MSTARSRGSSSDDNEITARTTARAWAAKDWPEERLDDRQADDQARQEGCRAANSSSFPEADDSYLQAQVTMAAIANRGGLTDAHKTIGIYRRLTEEARAAYLRISDRKRIEASFALVALVK